jgi:subtilase family serine protease
MRRNGAARAGGFISMRRPRILVALGALLASAVIAGIIIFPSAAGAVAQRPSGGGVSFARACGAVSAGFARCHAILRNNGKPGPAASPGGLNPVDLQSAYKLSATGGTGQTVAIVDAYNDPNAESDLGVYRAQFGLPICTTANGCFRKTDQNGGTSYPRGNTGWAEEISLDLDMVSAICPSCHILLVETKSNSFANLLAGDDYAASKANWISNSWSGGESSTEASNDSHFNKSGKVFTFASGDSGFGAQYPATSPYVVAVGGTSLSKAGNTRGWTETAWSGAGSGCSAYESQPSWQHTNANTESACPNNRAEADISAIGDPNTGVSVYDTYHTSGWLVFGGTSVATPIIAAVYALANNAGTVGGNASSLYSHTSNFFDVTSGSNGSCGVPLCTATTGWDGPTGLGTPNGSSGF